MESKGGNFYGHILVSILLAFMIFYCIIRIWDVTRFLKWEENHEPITVEIRDSHGEVIIDQATGKALTETIVRKPTTYSGRECYFYSVYKGDTESKYGSNGLLSNLFDWIARNWKAETEEEPGLSEESNEQLRFSLIIIIAFAWAIAQAKAIMMIK